MISPTLEELFNAHFRSAAYVAEAIIKDQKKVVPCSVYLEGEYGENNICIGVPVVLGRTGWEKIVDYPLNDEEKALFKASADAVRKTNGALSL